MTDPDAELRAGEAATYLGVSIATLNRWGDSGQVRYTRLPSGQRRYQRSDLDRLRTVVNPGPTTQEETTP